MPQDDLNVANGSGATVRQDINANLQALGTLMAGASAPSTTYAYMWWADTANDLLKQRNAANSAWIIKATLSAKYNGFVWGSRVMGARGVNNSGTPNTQFDMSADLVVLTDSDNQSVVQKNTGTLTNNISTAGPTAGGRDQAGAFSSGSFGHLYWIWNSSAMSTVSSASAPPTGPTLPTGYTHWAYHGSVYIDGSGNLKRVHQRGAWVYYDDLVVVLSGGSATTETNISLSAVVPSNALSVSYPAGMRTSAITVAGNDVARFRCVTGLDADVLNIYANASVVVNSDKTLVIAYVASNLIYLIERNSSGTVTLDLAVNGYKIPNGGE